MTFDPVAPAPALAVLAAVLVVLRLVSLRLAVTGGRESLARWAAMTVALSLVLLAAFRPGTGEVDDTENAATDLSGNGGTNVFFVVDRSADSGIPDFGGAPRISGMRADMAALMDQHPDARFAVISFSSRPAVEWPLSADSWSLTPVVAALNPYPPSDAQTNPAAAANVLRYQLIAAGQQYPGADNLVYYFGSGAEPSDSPQGAFESDGVDGGAVFGYGPGTGRDQLGAVADQLGVSFFARTPGTEVPQAQSRAADSESTESTVSNGQPRTEFYWLLSMVAAVLLLGEIYLSVRDLRRALATRRQVLT